MTPAFRYYAFKDDAVVEIARHHPDVVLQMSDRLLKSSLEGNQKADAVNQHITANWEFTITKNLYCSPNFYFMGYCFQIELEEDMQSENGYIPCLILPEYLLRYRFQAEYFYKNWKTGKYVLLGDDIHNRVAFPPEAENKDKKVGLRVQLKLVSCLCPLYTLLLPKEIS